MTGEDDVAYLGELVAEAMKGWEFGPVYIFGYSNGGFMAHHMAVQGAARAWSRRGQPGGYELRGGLELRSALPPVSVQAHPRHFGRRHSVRAATKASRTRRATASGHSTLGCAGDGDALEPSGGLRLARAPPTLCER